MIFVRSGPTKIDVFEGSSKLIYLPQGNFYCKNGFWHPRKLSILKILDILIVFSSSKILHFCLDLKKSKISDYQKKHIDQLS